MMPTDDFDVMLNDDFGCEYSLTWKHPKTHVEEEVLVTDRSNAEIRQVMLDIQTGQIEGPVKGVQGCSPLFPLLIFDLVFGFCVDYMHAVLLGV